MLFLTIEMQFFNNSAWTVPANVYIYDDNNALVFGPLPVNQTTGLCKIEDNKFNLIYDNQYTVTVIGPVTNYQIVTTGFLFSQRLHVVVAPLYDGYINLTVVDPNNVALPGEYVTVSVLEGEEISYEITSDANGKVQVFFPDKMSEGTVVTLSFYSPSGLYPTIVKNVLANSGPQAKTVVLGYTNSMVFDVIDQDGLPLQGADVSIFVGSTLMDTDMTGPDGEVTLWWLNTTASFNATVSKQGYSTYAGTVVSGL